VPRRSALALALLAPLALACAAKTPPPTVEDTPSAEELFRKGNTLLEGRRVLGLVPLVDHGKAIEAFQQIVDNYPYSDYAVLAEVKIADTYFDQGKYDEALSYYRDFGDLHPQHELVPYTVYRAAMCHYKQAKSANRDQTATRQALSFLDTLLSKYPSSPYAQDGEKLWKELRTRLADHELEIGDFYMNRQEYQSAADRYRDVLDKYPGLGLDADALYKLGVCYSKMNRTDEAKKIFEVLLKNYRGTDVAESAADWVPSAN
jgi:outer membrane protein assembly factor BamD